MVSGTSIFNRRQFSGRLCCSVNCVVVVVEVSFFVFLCLLWFLLVISVYYSWLPVFDGCDIVAGILKFF